MLLGREGYPGRGVLANICPETFRSKSDGRLQNIIIERDTIEIPIPDTVWRLMRDW
jgi:hypothetical protein